MNFIYFVALALCLFSVASCAKSTTPSPVSQDQINQYVNAAFEYSSMLGCNYTLVDGTLKYTLKYNKTNGDFLFNFTANISDAYGYISPINVYVNGTGNPQALFPIYTINFRGDLIPKFGYKFPNGKRYLSTNSSNLLALAAVNNIQLGWPFYCSGFQSLSENTTIVNYIDNVEPIQKDDHYEYVTLAKIRDGQQFCHSILISISNSYLNIAGIHFLVDCDETKVPVL